jgi:hypothetical protein
VKPIYDRFTGNDTEQTVYVGYTLLALAALAVWWGRPQVTRLWSISALIFFILSLGPYLHIMGQHKFSLKGMTVALPLPDYLLYVAVPILRTLRVASRFSIMLMLALVVLAGYGITYLRDRWGRRTWATSLCLSLIVVAVALEYVIAPVHLVDARTPAIYERIRSTGEEDGTLLDVPLRWTHFRYEYHQITHGKRLLLGQAPRLSLSLIATYADSVPFMKLFKSPEILGEYEGMSLDRRDVLHFIEFFDLSWIVIHKQLLAPDIFNRLMPFLRSHFPIAQEVEGDDIVALRLARDSSNADLLVGADGYFLDFGSTVPQFFLTEGYSIPERWGELTVAWSEGKASDLWVYFPRVEDFTMELRLLPFIFPDSPPQSMTIVVNGKPMEELTVATQAWRSYTVPLPKVHLKRGINTFRFLYRYAVSPASVIPGAQDPRRLGVAFDFVRFRPE